MITMRVFESYVPENLLSGLLIPSAMVGDGRVRKLALLFSLSRRPLSKMVVVMGDGHVLSFV